MVKLYAVKVKVFRCFPHNIFFYFEACLFEMKRNRAVSVRRRCAQICHLQSCLTFALLQLHVVQSGNSCWETVAHPSTITHLPSHQLTFVSLFKGKKKNCCGDFNARPFQIEFSSQLKQKI